MIPNIYPTSRKSNIIVKNLADEMLIYDLNNNKAFCLNKTSALIWQLCTGKNSVSTITGEMCKQFKELVSEDLVWLAIHQLSKDGLLEKEIPLTDHLAELSRREVIRKVGFTSLIALPIVTFITAPIAVNAQSCSTNNAACTSGPNCCSGNCLMTPNFGTKCCAMGSINGIPPGNNAFCTGNAGVCTSQAVQFCCSGSGALGPQGACDPGFSQCICS